ncbi:MAG: STAS domain-containing protein [Candidatus Omnitrophica bacterium]|nr:STAS domain-containing protein [Candidatus Omnitrophota bacterium]
MKKFEYKVSEESVNGMVVQIVMVEGYLDSSTFDKLQDALQTLIDDKQFYIIVEFGQLNYISSAGLGVLMGMLKEVRQNGGDLKLANMSSKVRNLFDMLGFSRLIRIYADPEEAKLAFVKDKNLQATAPESPRPEDDY